MARYSALSPRLPVFAVAGSIFLHSLLSIPLMLPGSTVQTSEVTFVDLAVSEPVTQQPVQSKPKPEMVSPSESPVIEEDEPVEKTEELETADQPEAKAQPQPQQQAQMDHVSLGLTRGYFHTLANGRTLHPELRDYYLDLMERVNEKWWAVEVDHRQIRNEVLAVVFIARNGVLVSTRIVKSSGDPAMDDMVVETIASAAPFSPLPEDYPIDFFQAPIRLMPPSAFDIF